jgi:hypothetical protein
MPKVKYIQHGTRAIWAYTLRAYMPDTDATANYSGNVSEGVYWNHINTFFVIFSFCEDQYNYCCCARYMWFVLMEAKILVCIFSIAVYYVIHSTISIIYIYE